jgi:hypothetical protein
MLDMSSFPDVSGGGAPQKGFDLPINRETTKDILDFGCYNSLSGGEDATSQDGGLSR